MHCRPYILYQTSTCNKMRSKILGCPKLKISPWEFFNALQNAHIPNIVLHVSSIVFLPFNYVHWSYGYDYDIISMAWLWLAHLHHLYHKHHFQFRVPCIFPKTKSNFHYNQSLSNSQTSNISATFSIKANKQSDSYVGGCRGKRRSSIFLYAK